MIKESFENIMYGGYTQNDYFNDLLIKYKQKLFTKLPIDFLTGNKVEMFKVVLIEQLFDNIR